MGIYIWHNSGPGGYGKGGTFVILPNSSLGWKSSHFPKLMMMLIHTLEISYSF